MRGRGGDEEVEGGREGGERGGGGRVGEGVGGMGGEGDGVGMEEGFEFLFDLEGKGEEKEVRNEIIKKMCYTPLLSISPLSPSPSQTSLNSSCAQAMLQQEDPENVR